MASKQQKKAAALKRALKESGRTVQWLADSAGYSRGYVSNVLAGKMPMSEEFQRRAAAALSTHATVPVQFRGRTISVPENIFKNAADLPLIAVESAYEEAWKVAWLQENAPTVLATAAERAWQVEQLAA